MSTIGRLKNRALSKVVSRIPSVGKRLVEAFSPIECKDIPWAPLDKPLSECRVALVTTGGIHHDYQEPFDMHDPDGDPTYRLIDTAGEMGTLTITHDYYDHSDAEADLNIVLPVERLREFAEKGVIAKASGHAYSFMGHITGKHIDTLIKQTAPEVAARLNAEGVDAVIVTPA